MSQPSAENIVAIRDIQDKYVFKKKLGQGGYGDVFLAENKKTGNKVAIKMVEMNSGNEKVDRRIARFRREMLLYGQIDHPNIVKVVDSGETETGLLFIVFEYIHGKTLAQLLKKEGALSLNRTMTLMKQVLAGLRAAHEKGIIHRDLKPENVMVVVIDNAEQIKILDFGISTFIKGQFGEMPPITATKEFLGTPVYAAPEQLRGEPVTPKVDIYAWGLLFLECIMGKAPFAGATVASIVQQQLASSPIPLPPALVDHRLGTLLRWTLEKQPDRRAGSCAIIASHLENVSLNDISQSNGFVVSDSSSDNISRDSDFMVYETVISTQERRQVTVVCFSLNMHEKPDSTSPDVLDEIYQDLMMHGCDLFKRFGAHVITDAGDRILAFFGYPDASDTDARRAARSALEIAALMVRRNIVFSNWQGLQLSFRIGIHTGMVTVRKMNDGKPQMSGIITNFVGKLCNATDANSIFLSESSHTLLKDFLECNEVSENAASRLISDNHAYRVIGERRVEGLCGSDRFTASPMVGRDGDLAWLRDKWKTIGNKNAVHAVMIQGEAGIGKSRLAAEFALSVVHENGAWLECRCLPEGKNSALHPVIEFFRNHFGLSAASSPGNAVSVLENNLKSFGIDCTVAMPLFCAWLNIPCDTYPALALSPQRQKECMLNYTAEILAKIAKASSGVIMIEDLHWADPTTLELLPKLFEQLKKNGVFLLMSARPVFSPSWNNYEVEILTINHLEDADVEKVISNIMGSDVLPKDAIAQIVSRVDGVPLFAEEVTRMMREKTNIKDEIPSTLRDLLVSKIDHLGPAKETAQLASVLGRTFDYNVIEKVSLKDAASLLADLDQLISAGLLHVRLRIGNPQYVFHHALVRDAAFESLSQKTKEEMNFRIADILEKEFKEIASSQPELLAHHWAGAGEFEKATSYGIQAATQYLTKSFYAESIHHATESLEWVKEIKDDKLKIDSELQLLQLLIPAYISTKGFAAPELEKINNRTDELREKLSKDSAFLTSILWGKVIYYHATPDYVKLEYYMQEALSIGEETDNKDLLSALHSVKSHFCLSHGRFKESVKNAALSIEHYKQKKIMSHGKVFGNDSKVLSLGIQALSLTIHGDIYSACKFMDQSIEFATSINDPSSKGLAFAYQLCFLHEKNEKNIIEKYCIEFKKFINKYGLESWLNIVELYNSWATGDVEKAKQCLNIFQIIVSRQIAPYWNFITAQVEYDLKLYIDCLKRVEMYIKQSFDVGEIFYVPELYRLKALCIAQTDSNNRKEIEKNFNSACAFADKIEAHLFRLRALLDFYKTVSNPLTQNKCLVQLKNTLEIFKKFKQYHDHYEIKEAMKLISIGK